MEMDSKETKDFFVQAFRNGDLVPILGSGFSCGMSARKTNTVPTGGQLKKYMIDLILSERSDFTRKDLEKQNFSWISERFFKCDMDKIIKYFYDNFTGIQFVGANKKEFLNGIDWSYIYTLNIDTAIENASNDWEVFYPNRMFMDKSVFDKKKLYKVHGDINIFMKNKNIDELIFSETQYIKSLSTNTLFHDKLAADCQGKNLLYLGCSLDDEIDIKFSVISDTSKNIDPISTRRIYVTHEDIQHDAIKIENLESFKISHYIKLESLDDYEMFYEFIVQCYKESLVSKKEPIEYYEVMNIEVLEADREANLNYLVNSLNESKILKPYYFYNRSGFSMNMLSQEKINVFIGRRFSGKTMFAYSIIDYFQDRKKYYISSNETISDANLYSLLNQKNILVIFDANTITEEQLSFVCRTYKEQQDRNNIICIFMNTFDDIVNIVTYYSDVLETKSLDFKGYLTDEENEIISKKLNSMGILAFDKNQTILDNTIRIGNKLQKYNFDKYSISDKKELVLLIWIAVFKKVYLEEIFALSLYNEYRIIVEKFAPILEIERRNIGENFENSAVKIICNAPIALLQILNLYAYPLKSTVGNVIKKQHFEMICAAIYHILFSYEKRDSDKAKKFLMFDILNDIFSKQYSKENIERLLKEEKEDIQGTKFYGAAALIQAIYENTDIQKLKSGEPNYWLQRAKSLYILNSGKNGKIQRLQEGIEWGKIAEGDSETLIRNGQTKYYRTLSNAIIQIAMIYGKLAFKFDYENIDINTQAVNYYYKGLSDTNNIQTSKSLIARSKGKRDFVNLLNKIKLDVGIVHSEAIAEAEYLCNIPEYANGIVYRLK